MSSSLAGHQTLLERLRAVLGAVVVVLIYTALVVGQVVEQVVGAWAKTSPDDQQNQ